MGPSRVRVGSPRGWVGAPCAACGWLCCVVARAGCAGKGWRRSCHGRSGARSGDALAVTPCATDRARSFPSGRTLPGRSRLGLPRPGRGWRGWQGHGLGGLGRRWAELSVPCESAAPPWGQLAPGVALEGLPQPPCCLAQRHGHLRTRTLAQGDRAAHADEAIRDRMGGKRGEKPVDLFVQPTTFPCKVTVS